MAVPDQPPAASGIGLVSMGGGKSALPGLDRLCDQLPRTEVCANSVSGSGEDPSGARNATTVSCLRWHIKA